jgi:hypothetical protein
MQDQGGILQRLVATMLSFALSTSNPSSPAASVAAMVAPVSIAGLLLRTYCSVNLGDPLQLCRTYIGTRSSCLVLMF